MMVATTVVKDDESNTVELGSGSDSSGVERGGDGIAIATTSNNKKTTSPSTKKPTPTSSNSRVTLKGIGLSTLMLGVIVIIASLLGTKNGRKEASDVNGNLGNETATTSGPNEENPPGTVVMIGLGPVIPPRPEIRSDENVTFYMYSESGPLTSRYYITDHIHTVNGTDVNATAVEFIYGNATEFSQSNTEYTQYVCNDTGFYQLSASNNSDSSDFDLLWEDDPITILNLIDHIKIYHHNNGLDDGTLNNNIAFERTRHNPITETHTTEGINFSTRYAYILLDSIKLNLMKYNPFVVPHITFDFSGLYSGTIPCSNSTICIQNFIKPPPAVTVADVSYGTLVHQYTVTGFVTSEDGDGDTRTINDESSSEDIATTFVCSVSGFESPNITFDWVDSDDYILDTFDRVYHLNNDTSYVAFEKTVTTSSTGEGGSTRSNAYSFTTEGTAYYTGKGKSLLRCIQFYLEKYNPTIYAQLAFA